MKRLTTDTPRGNFETMLNFVYGKDGWAYIRHDGEHEDVKLTDWAKRQCLLRGCDEVFTEAPEEIDQLLCDCMMEAPICPIAMAYCFASQAVHLRSRLKMYEDTGLGPEEIIAIIDGAVKEFEEYDELMPKHRIQELAQAEKDGRMVVLPCKVGNTVYVTYGEGYKACIVSAIHIIANGKSQIYAEHLLTEKLVISDAEFGKTVFLTREEAEAALKKREEGEL